MACDKTLLIWNGAAWEDIQDTAHITNASGIMSDAPSSGDLIAQDWSDVAVWQQGPRAPWSFDVPLLMRNTGSENDALVQLLHIQSFVGTGVRQLRRVTPLTGTHEVQGVFVSATQVEWELDRRAWVRAVMVVQALGPWVAVP